MIKYILGSKGSGKTKWLIDNANEDMKSGDGNIAFVEVDDDHIFSLDYNVRLINATDYRLNSINSFYGFICGLLAMDYDLHKIYIDGIYKVLPLNIEDLEYLFNRISKIPDAENKEIFINVDYLKTDMPETLSEHCLEVTNE
ncbi:myosin-crossreactive antigen [Peptoniphilus olsenii]|uniref:Myosin-crossreactive antigen n=1 Tax=Peptoniphilus olsenii TaxID=411570 RepID=A0ABV2JCM8_9FIRM